MAVNIMIQGTMSNAGKSLIAAGLCRVFTQDGYRVAPFKSQNMALNSYVTEEGLEMGRAQVVQAQACRKKPSVRMNPILLKPTTDVGSQVIVNGKSRGNMKAADYFRYKKELIPDILRAYESLAAENDIIVMEGAGSPAEINLKEDDIVNMGLAELLDAPVLLVGDIDRGGVFAQLAGTMLLLEDKEKERVRGLIINKFRGDVEILRPGLRMAEEICQRPVLGVVPFAQVDIDDEDSLTERFAGRRRTPGSTGPAGRKPAAYGAGGPAVLVAVIRLPRISNFSDFSILEAAPGVELVYTDRPADLADADLIILPGTKSTISDLQWLKRRGLGNALIAAARRGTPVVGICGGYQMLGQQILDPEGQEAAVEENGTAEAVADGTSECISGDFADSSDAVTGCGAAGLGLLPVITEFEPEKETVQTDAEVCGGEGDLFASLEGIDLQGYEIHMGFSRITDPEARPFAAVRGPQRYDGCVRGNVMGTYLHGLFDSRAFTEGLLAAVSGRHITVPDLKAYREEQYEKLAAVIRESLDMEAIYGIMGLSR